MKSLKPTALTFHCTATRNGQPVPVSTIRQWHLRRGFKNIGYHFVIQPDGTIEKGRSLEEQGAHVAGYNLMSNNEQRMGINVGVAMCGNDKFSLAQFERAGHIINNFHLDHHIPLNKFYVHRDFTQKKTCPNFRMVDLMMWYVTEQQYFIDKHLIKVKA